MAAKTLFPGAGPRQKRGFACGNAQPTRTRDPERCNVTPPRPFTLRVCAHVCSWYWEVGEARRLVLTRSETFPFRGTSTRPGSDPPPAALRRATRLILPSETEFWSLVVVWNVRVAVALADTTAKWVVE